MGGLRSRNTIQTGGITGRDTNGSKTYAYREGKNYSQIKRFTKPANPNSLAQQLVRQSFSNLSARWSQLTDEQRESWNKAATSPQWQNSDGFGGNTSLTGKALYVGVNTRLLANGFEEALVGESSPVIVTESTVLEISYFAGGVNGTKSISLVNKAGSADEVYVISATGLFTAGTNPSKKTTTILYKGNDLYNNEGATIDFEPIGIGISLKSLYENKFGVGQTNQRLKLEVFIINRLTGFQKKIASENIILA